jgi:glycosidase
MHYSLPDIRVIVEIIPNHTSRKHKWFQESRKGGNHNTYKGYYIWDSGRLLKNGTRVPPSNWVSNHQDSWNVLQLVADCQWIDFLYSFFFKFYTSTTMQS